jgi:predicted GIY-YIG superfamily endonuclease
MDLVQQARDFLTQTNSSPNTPITYILRLSSGAYYVGATTNLLQRMSDHLAGAGGKTTREVESKTLLFAESHPSFSSARKREAQIKRWSRSKKEALANRDMETLRFLSKSHE